MASSVILSAAGSLAIKMADSALDKSSAKIIEYLSDRAKDTKDILVTEFRLGFQVFVQASYERCRTYKTLLNPYVPLPVLDNYIHVDVEIGDKRFSDDTLISGIRPNARVIVTGLAGGGKLMKSKTLRA